MTPLQRGSFPFLSSRCFAHGLCFERSTGRLAPLGLSQHTDGFQSMGDSPASMAAKCSALDHRH